MQRKVVDMYRKKLYNESTIFAGKGRVMKNSSKQERQSIEARRDDEQSGDSMSIENQRSMLTRYAKENGLEIIDWYIMTDGAVPTLTGLVSNGWRATLRTGKIRCPFHCSKRKH